jgi:hypothetical protein
MGIVIIMGSCGVILSTSWGILGRHRFPSTRLYHVGVARRVVRAELLDSRRVVLPIGVALKSLGLRRDRRRGVRIFV